MNVTLPKNEKIKKRTVLIYIIALLICIISISIVVGIYILGNDVVDNFFGIRKLTQRTQEEELELKANFDNIFDNKLSGVGDFFVYKIDDSQEIIYTGYSKKEKNESTEINVNIPYINIKNNDVKDFNENIIKVFEDKAESVLNDNTSNILYTVNYKAYIENNILSVIICSNLKQNTDAQRIIIETFNYNLETNKKLLINDLMKIYDLNVNDVQNKINKDLKTEQKKSEDLQKLGYNVFSRDLTSNYYNVENIKEFFIYNGNIYIIFAYGNEDLTSQKDLVIL